jgi:hypothetical protein
MLSKQKGIEKFYVTASTKLELTLKAKKVTKNSSRMLKNVFVSLVLE